MSVSFILVCFFFNDTATTEIYTLSLHDALPIYDAAPHHARRWAQDLLHIAGRDRKSTRLNSSHLGISYAVFCLKKKKKENCVRGMWLSRRFCGLGTRGVGGW